MAGNMNWILGLGALILLGLLFYWLVIITEGVYLGRRVVVWLYDLTAGSYDQIKEFDEEFERSAIVRPLLAALAGQYEPFVLDVATGTGRVPLLLINEADFNGRVVGLDASAKMLAQGLEKIASLPAERKRQINLIRQAAENLPFADNSFDAVTCLEALEFFPSDRVVLKEMVRVLQPGGTLMTTRRQGWESRFYLSRYRSKETLAELLEDVGLNHIEYYPWQVNYDMVRALKSE